MKMDVIPSGQRKVKKRKLPATDDITGTGVPGVSLNKKQKLEFDGNDVSKADLKSCFGISMLDWDGCFVPRPVLKALSEQGFSTPTPIQKHTLPPAIRDKADILGAAETGSGKTLAFGIPIIRHILDGRKRKKNSKVEECINSDADSSADTKSPTLKALIVTPTRELAIQIKNHLLAVTKYTDIKVGVVIGGLSQQKQERLLKRCPEIVVGTPGRLWEMIDEGEPHLSRAPNVRYLVIDEADRMVEKGHFEDLSKLLALMNCSEGQRQRRQTFVFSATLTLIHAPPKRVLLKKRKYRLNKKHKLGNLVNMIGMRENNMKVIDLTRKTGTVETLTETRIMCMLDEKDVYLYYFLHHYPGRTIVFCNSIDCVRRLRSLFSLLGFKPLALHSSLHQKQRLKNLETFQKEERALLLATDIAARGLDIPGIEHVVHYQVPQTAESYIHRSGRTARAQKDGLSLLMISPEEVVQYRRHCKTLGRDYDLPMFPIDVATLKAVKERVLLAREIETQEHRYERMVAQNRWFVKAARDLDVDIDEEEKLFHNVGDDQAHAAHMKAIKTMKKQLNAMLKKPLALQGFSGKYPTKMGSLPAPAVKCGEKAMAVVKNHKDESWTIDEKNKLFRKKNLFKKKKKRKSKK